MGKIDVVAELQADNPRQSVVTLTMFADALAAYIEATENIKKNGAICSHPRTGAPIENPYLKLQQKQIGVIQKLGRNIKSDRVMRMIDGEK